MVKLAILGLLQLATGNPVFDGSAGTVRSEGWSMSGLTTAFELSDSGLRGEIRIAELRIPDEELTIGDVRIFCAAIVLTTRSVSCDRSEFAATLPIIGRQTTAGSFAYDRHTGATQIAVSKLAVAGGSLRLDLVANAAGIDARFRGEQLGLAGLLELARSWDGAFAEYSAGGSADATGHLLLEADGDISLSLHAKLAEASFANDAGTLAGEGIEGRLVLGLTRADANTDIALVVDGDAGEAYLEPVYANFTEHALHLAADGVRTADFATFDIGRFRLLQDSLLDVSGSARLTLPGDGAPMRVAAGVELHDCSAAVLYTNLVQVMLAGTVLGDLEADGRLSGTVSVADNAPTSARLQLDDLILDDRQGRFAVYGLGGTLDWQAAAHSQPAQSVLRWDSGTAYNIILGGGEARLQLGGTDVELLAPLRIPTMGGALRINRLALKDFGGDEASGVLDAELEPIQLGQLTGAFGWPAFAGTLSGRLPLLQLAGDAVTVGGTLGARAFDGTIEMSNLRIEQPFGRVPRLTGDLRLRNLDLQRITEEFSFGSIQGRLSGDVAGLKMRNWSPVQMDMHFYTPNDDDSPHRISQRAVENLASVGGGGATAVLSSGLLRYFEVFAYDRIGVRCVLHDGVCTMSGAGTLEDAALGAGYYIVKGRGLPRIDVVGYRSQVSWPRLVRQLGAITSGGTPTVN